MRLVVLALSFASACYSTRSNMVVQLGATNTAAILPAVLVDDLRFDEDDDRPPSTPGEIYAQMGGAFKDAFIVSLATLLPPAAQGVTAEVREGKAERRVGAHLGSLAGTLVGTIAIRFVVRESMPKWVRVTLSTLLIGTATTFGYQLGGGGPDD